MKRRDFNKLVGAALVGGTTLSQVTQAFKNTVKPSLRADTSLYHHSFYADARGLADGDFLKYYNETRDEVYEKANGRCKARIRLVLAEDWGLRFDYFRPAANFEESYHSGERLPVKIHQAELPDLNRLLKHDHECFARYYMPSVSEHYYLLKYPPRFQPNLEAWGRGCEIADKWQDARYILGKWRYNITTKSD